MSYFEKNIFALAKHNQFLHEKLSSFGDVESFEIFMDEEDNTTLNFVNIKNFTPLYEGSPTETIKEQLDEFKLFAKYPYLYFYGMGNGGLIKELLQNEKHKRIVVVEPEVELLYVVFHMFDFSNELESKRLVIVQKALVSFTDTRALFDSHQEQKYAKVYDLHVNTNYYNRLYIDDIVESNRAFLEGVYHAINGAGNDAKDALIGLKHHIFNLPKLLQTPTTVELLNKLNQATTAVLVSTGPSLTKQIPLLKEIAPYVRIVAVDASFPVLYKAGIKPDVVVSMERVKESARFFEQVPKDGYDDVVIALSSLQHRDVVKSPKGGILQMSLRPLGYMIETGPKDWGYLGIGSSAANMGFELIYYSRIKNCILIGQDLAYSEDGKSHASGHVFGENDVETKESDVWVQGWGGEKKVRTNHTWTMFRNYFEKDLADIKETMTTVNATEGGARIHGTKELTFEEAAKIYVDKTVEKQPLVLEYKSSTELEDIAKQTEQNIEAIVEYVSALLEDTKKLFLDVAKASEAKDVSVEKMYILIDSVESLKSRQNEEIYDKVVWHIAQAMMLVQEIELAPTEVYVSKSEDEEKERLRQLLEAHKAWLFSFAGIMDAILKTIKFAQARRLIDEVERIDVYCDDKKIDSFTIEAMQPKLGRVFDVDMRGILYDTSDEYQEQLESITFKDAITNKELPQAFVSVIKRDDIKYNELSFMNSLEKPSCDTLIVGSYTPNTIGFLATKENLEDEAFMDYISELQNSFKDAKIIAYIFQNRLDDEVKAFEKLVVQDVSQLEHTQVLILNQKNELDRLVLYKANWNNIFLLSFTGLDMQKSLKELYVEGMVDLYRKHSDVFELTVEDVEKLNNHILIGTVISLKNVEEEEGLEQLFDVNKTPQERSYKLIDLAFKNQTFIQNIVELRMKLHKMVL
ncbi:MAG: motility associated factor glycosyltransferase family protein [Campylobacterales bacterium]|nr:motility associated factor glycosyltransferase family protein [Campylobacterales bacterium]